MFYIEEFLYHLKILRYSPGTVKKYAYLLCHFKYSMQSSGVSEVKNVSHNEACEYLEEIKKKKISDAEYALKISKLKKYFGYLEKNNHIFISPLIDYECPKYPKKHYPALSQEEIKSILEKISTDHPLCLKGRAIIELAYSSALRPRELYNLKLVDIDFKKGLLFLEQSKNRKDRIAPVGKVALNWLEKYIRDVRPKYLKNKTHGYVFINHKTGETLTRWGIRSAIRETLRMSGLKPIIPYSLRSTAATALLLNGMNIAYISTLLGHTDIRTTQIYLRVKVKKLQQELAFKHPRVIMEKQYNSMKEVKENEV